jgi:hypothetical protein
MESPLFWKKLQLASSHFLRALQKLPQSHWGESALEVEVEELGEQRIQGRISRRGIVQGLGVAAVACAFGTQLALPQLEQATGARVSRSSASPG